jgi:NhaP-type Na+/H+ or K+/H+ antiporter|tara:strand:+ start:450 stop:2444 length:1995 start_codon:yes stop_codon:yes gene_type:complete
MAPLTHPELTVALALAAGILAQSVSRLLRLPGIVLLLASGALLGPEGVGWIEPRSLGDGLFGIVDFAVAIILFEGGLNLEWSRLKRQEAAIRRLITWGTLMTFVGASALAALLLGWRWNLAILFGALVVVTGPTVIQPLLRDMRLRPRLKTILEAESVLIDPIGALLAGFILQLVTRPSVTNLASQTWDVALSIGFGLLAGLAAGFLLAAALRYRLLIAHGYENIFTLAGVVLLFEACDGVMPPSGLVAVTVAGVVIGNLETRVGEDLREFKDQLTVLLVGMLFILLAADVALDDVRALGVGGLTVVGGLILVVRPLSVWVSTRGVKLTTRERVFIGAIAPRGIVAAAIASITAAALETQAIEGGAALRALVFSTIGGTVVLSGVLAHPLAWLLDLRLPQRDRVAIFGAQGLGLPLAEALRAGGVPVLFIESDPKRTHVAEQAGHAVVFGDPFDDRTMQRARMELVGTAVGLTFNEHANRLFVREAREAFGVTQGFVAMESFEDQHTRRLLQRSGLDMLFDGPHDQPQWDVRWRHGDVDIESFEYQLDVAPGAPPPAAGDTPTSQPRADEGPVINVDEVDEVDESDDVDQHVMLTVCRGKRTALCHLGYEPQPGDVAAVALHRPARQNAIVHLARRGWTPRTKSPPADAEAGVFGEPPAGRANA